MPRVFSPQAVEALMAQNTAQAFILLVTFSHGSDVFHACLNTEPITSRGVEYTPTYFNFQLPEVSEAAPSSCQIIVDNVDQRMVDLLRRITTPIQVKIEMVLGSQPDVVEMTLEDLVMRNVTWDSQHINGKLEIEDMLNSKFPAYLYEPRTFPGIF